MYSAYLIKRSDTLYLAFVSWLLFEIMAKSTIGFPFLAGYENPLGQLRKGPRLGGVDWLISHNS